MFIVEKAEQTEAKLDIKASHIFIILNLPLLAFGVYTLLDFFPHFVARL